MFGVGDRGVLLVVVAGFGCWCWGCGGWVGGGVFGVVLSRWGVADWSGLCAHSARLVWNWTGIGSFFLVVCVQRTFFKVFWPRYVPIGGGAGEGEGWLTFPTLKVVKVSRDTCWLAGFEAFRCVFFCACHWLASAARGWRWVCGLERVMELSAVELLRLFDDPALEEQSRRLVEQILSEEA